MEGIDADAIIHSLTMIEIALTGAVTVENIKLAKRLAIEIRLRIKRHRRGEQQHEPLS